MLSVLPPAIDTPSWPGYLTPCHTTPTNGQSAKTTKLVDGLPVVVSVVVLVLTEVVVMVVAVDSAARSARTDSFQSFNHSNQSLRGGWANPGKKKLFSSHGVHKTLRAGASKCDD